MVSEILLSEVIESAVQAAGIKKPEKIIVLENDEFTAELVCSNETLKEALAIMREGFYPDESICNGVKLGIDLTTSEVKIKANDKQLSGEQGVSELEALTLDTAKDGISIVIIEKKSGKVAGAAFNKIQRRCVNDEKGFFESFRDNHCQSLSAIALIDTMIEVDSRYDAFDHYKVNTALEVMFLATRPSFRKRGVGVLLMKASIQAAKSRGIPLVVALMTSLHTQRIGRVIAMEELLEVGHEELFFLGEPISERTGIHKSTILMAKRVCE